MKAKNPNDLSKEALAEIVCSARDFLFHGEVVDEETGEIQAGYSLDNDVSGADFVDHMNFVLGEHGLTPVDDPTETALKALEERGITYEDLDELVHQVCSEQASGINNEGIESQVDFLLEHMSVDVLLSTVEQTHDECPNWEAGVQCDCDFCTCQREIEQGQA